MNRQTKRILVVKGLGAAGSWLLWGGAIVATDAAAYEAVMICDNSNDLREMLSRRNLLNYLFLLYFEWCPEPDLNRHDRNDRGILSSLHYGVTRHNPT